MSTATVTSKGQITVPKDVREALRLAPGARLAFHRNAAGEIVVTRDLRNAGDLAGLLAYDGPPKTLADMEADIEAGATGA